MGVEEAIENHKDLKSNNIGLSLWLKKHLSIMASATDIEKQIIQKYLKDDYTFKGESVC